MCVSVHSDQQSVMLLPSVLQVNVIPVIAKADTLTPEECQRFKKNVSRYTLQLLSQCAYCRDCSSVGGRVGLCFRGCGLWVGVDYRWVWSL